jgi:hypothetical protein
MIDAFQLVFLLLLCIFIVLGFYTKTQRFSLNPILFWTFFGLVIVYILVSRLLYLDQLPGGLNQDEAAIGYDAWALATYGIDRNGYTFPILPMSWGSGAGGFIIYLGSFLFRVIPLTVYTLRLSNALVQLATLLAFFLFLKRFFNKEVALIGLAYLAISPWHFMLSRWNLDANQVFSLILIGLYLSSIGFEKHKKRFHLLGLTFFSLAMYSYGSGIIVVPLLLIILYGKAWLDKKFTFRDLVIYGSFTTLLSLPLIAFYIINTYQLPAIVTPLFSIPLFNVLRSNSVIIPFDEFFFAKAWENLRDTLIYLSTGKGDWLWNQLPGYGIAFLFTFPLLLVGLITQRNQVKSFPFYAWLIVSFLFSLVLYQNTNRMGVLFLPMIYFHVQGLAWLIQKSSLVWIPSFGLIATASVLFHISYSTSYANDIKSYFAYGYEQAIKFALSLEKTEYYLPSQNQVNGSHVIALFFIQPDPHDVVETGIYLNPGAEFQYLSEFESNDIMYRFQDPQVNQNLTETMVFITKINFQSYFVNNNYEINAFSNFIVIYI